MDRSTIDMNNLAAFKSRIQPGNSVQLKLTYFSQNSNGLNTVMHNLKAFNNHNTQEAGKHGITSIL